MWETRTWRFGSCAGKEPLDPEDEELDAEQTKLRVEERKEGFDDMHVL
jgi:hypothetical protein